MRSIFLFSFSHRAFGKLAFLTLRDDFGTIQLYSEKVRFLSDQFDELKNLVDIGDILGANGSIKRTEKGEISVYVNSFAILTKSLLPLPDKYHGLTHVDKRYQQRYIDMISNPEVADVFRKRAKSYARQSFGFLEVETPVLQGAAGGAEARPFVTYHNLLGRDLYLRIATELHLKRMLLGGGYLFGLPLGFVADSIGATIGATAAFILGRTQTSVAASNNDGSTTVDQVEVLQKVLGQRRGHEQGVDCKLKGLGSSSTQRTHFNKSQAPPQRS
ncbi:lysine--tRNA ligase, chloroplastic/mitochondrial-like [Humulus lupulus]|uniref:lysine--tRNA ligase, chloroplastic/mitochondrial-like n=1 Tax=Humulus lupulus TaxID=3486 RepID=UPI002B40344C|nr:lysine--tRNA ligase, chloroplastic/mitochondrial-like [Humulus lupulus]